MLMTLVQAESKTGNQLPASENHMSRGVAITPYADSPRMTHQRTRDRGMLAMQ